MLRAFFPPLAALCLALLPATFPLQAEEKSTEPTKEPAPAVERAPLEERSQDDAISLERQLPGREQQQLKAADESFLALWQPANAGEPSGVLILLPGEGESADWPEVIGPLRRQLPNAGWSTLSLTLPDPSGDPVPPRPVATEAPGKAEPAVSPEKAQEEGPANTEQAGSAEPNTDPAPPALSRDAVQKAQTDRVFARIEAALAFARQQKPRSIVLLGHGTGAYWATQFLITREPQDVRNLLLVAAELPAGYEPALEDSLPALKLATGDFYYKDLPADRDAALRRLHASKRQKHPAYIQITMKGLPADRATEQEQLVRRIRGWLSLHLQAGADKGQAGE
ncbi:alpha/beta hydrolase family protein [Pseudomonas sp. TCU-HL1]|uniref:alpha/beta hydrolase family protein n=1 Tax=Pseudomonas sp. TCU-HL1 TaxID=1856685 RepID=UPI00083CB5AB|nr:alpha/beta hydrolase family protein [Pseudomonas sp. TCU-HL1]AOE83073.1 hydrolase or acyltransferase [Pseudomonas sp. TCU-HL1]